MTTITTKTVFFKISVDAFFSNFCLDYPEDFDDNDFDDHRPTKGSHSVDDEIDEETQKIYDMATEARKNYNVANDNFKDLERKVNEIEEQADVDFGKDDVFLTMYKKCYELKTAEYIYSVRKSS